MDSDEETELHSEKLAMEVDYDMIQQTMQGKRKALASIRKKASPKSLYYSTASTSPSPAPSAAASVVLLAEELRLAAAAAAQGATGEQSVAGPQQHRRGLSLVPEE